jgi:hypothetical protein
MEVTVFLKTSSMGNYDTLIKKQTFQPANGTPPTLRMGFVACTGDGSRLHGNDQSSKKRTLHPSLYFYNKLKNISLITKNNHNERYV